MALLDNLVWGFLPETCIYCSSLVSRGEASCGACQALWRERGERERIQNKVKRHDLWKSVKIRYLFQWVRDKDPALSKLVSALKQGQRPRTWRWVAELFNDHHLLNLPSEFLHETYLIPLPGKGGQFQDHSYWWAAALAESLNRPFGTHLHVTEGGRQKTRSRQERSRIRMEVLRPPPEAGVYILVDDILTTGATSRAAMEALAREGLHDFEIWTLAFRSRLAP